MKTLWILGMMFCWVAPESWAASLEEQLATQTSVFLNQLSPEQKKKSQFSFSHEDRKNWHFVPKDRKGADLRKLNASQRNQVQEILKTVLSARGIWKVETIRKLETVLTEFPFGPDYDENRYFLAVFGEPGSKKWGFRFEGHHLSLNFTILEGKLISTTPNFWGANPATVKKGDLKGTRVLEEEEELAWKLIRSLSKEQKKKAIFSNWTPSDLELGPSKKAKPLKPFGISYSELNASQKQNLQDLIKAYITHFKPTVSDQEWNEIQKAGLDRLSFGWAGGIGKTDHHYYRVQGPTFVLEFSNSRNSANHIHSAWRDLSRDFGESPLLRHLREHPH